MGEGLRRARAAARATQRRPNKERLASAALIRDGQTHCGDFKEHWRIRALLGDENPTTSNLNDVEGFLTTTGRFVTRDEARAVAIECGQIGPQWRDASRKLLSSDINW